MKIIALAAVLALLGADVSFDVASIKRDADLSPGVTFAARGGTLTVERNPLSNVIGNAYNVRRYQLVGGPDWVYEDRYSIHAKAAGDATREQMMKMVQTLLAERFKLSVHRDTREMPIYLLTVAKGGIRAPRSVDGACVQFDPRNPPRPGAPRQPFCGNNLTRVNSWIATAIDMDAAAGALVGVLGRKVINRTGIEGTFDINVQWTPDQASDGAGRSHHCAEVRPVRPVDGRRHGDDVQVRASTIPGGGRQLELGRAKRLFVDLIGAVMTFAELGYATLIDVESGRVEFAGECDREREADVAEADHNDTGRSIHCRGL